MAYKVKIGQFAKNIESTAQPDTTLWPEYDVVFKNGADISNPQITISATYANVQNANYAYMLGRYYWITAKNLFRENYIILQLKVDVLATYKTEIGSSSLYILRASAAYDGNIKDNMYPLTAKVDTLIQDQPAASVPSGYSSGYVILNVAGTGTVGATTLIELTTGDFKNLIAELYTAIDGFQLSDVIQNVVKAFGGNPTKLINSALWVPYAFYGNNYDYVQIGSWTSSSIRGLYLDSTVYTTSDYSYTIYKHPQAATRGDYLNLAPFSKYTLCIPCCGVVDLDTTQLLENDTINIHYIVDALTGQMIAEVSGDDNSQMLAFLSGQVGVPISLGEGNNIDSTIAGVGGVVTRAISAGITGSPIALAGAISAGIDTAISTIEGPATSSGMGGGLQNIITPGWLSTIHYYVADEDNARNGRPYCQVTTPATLGSGFMIASKGDVVMSGPLPEHEEVKRYLETGFFYE